MDSMNKLGIVLSPIDQYPRLLTTIEDAGEHVRNLKEDKPSIVKRAQSEEENSRIQLGILCFMLSERSQTPYDFKDLFISSRDGLKMCTSHILIIINEHWNRINTEVRSNLLSLLIDLLTTPWAEGLFSAIFKRMTSGDLTQSNLWLIENMLNLIEEHKDAIIKDRKLLSHIAYTYLRLIPTHYQFSIAMNTPNNTLARLCRKEINLVLDIIKTNFDDCFKSGGRDLMFVIQQVSNIPDFKNLWNDMCQNIESMSNHFTNVGDIFSIGTNKNIISTSIPFDMETWILWTMRNVHHCSSNPYKKYQDFLSKRFFSTPESQNLRPFLIRYIIRCFYPDNEMIGSTLISRWATISWLIVQASSSTVVANCKLALIYDWLFYDQKYDCIMDIEPAILAIMHNLTKYSNVSITLIDFMIKTVNLYMPAVKEKMINCVRMGLAESIRVNVFRSLQPLTDVLRHQPDLLKQFSDLIGDPSLFSAFANVNNTNNNNNNNTPMLSKNEPVVPVLLPEKNGTQKQVSSPLIKQPPSLSLEHVNKSSLIIAKPIINNTNNNNLQPTLNIYEPKPVIIESVIEPEKPCFDEVSFDDLKRRFMKYSLAFDYNVERIEVPSTISQINSSITSALENLYEAAEQCRSLISKGKSKRDRKLSKRSPKKVDIIDDAELSASDEENLQDLYEKMEQVVIAILNDDNFDDLGTAGKTASVICEICYPYFERRLYPENPDEEKLKSSLSHPIFILFRNFCSMSNQDNKRELLLLLLSEMQMRQPRVGYYLLYFLKVATINDPNLGAYRSLCNSLDKPNLKNSLYKDLELLSNDDTNLMVFLLPDLYRAFKPELVGNPKFAHLIISSLDAAEISQLGLEIQKKDIEIVDSDSVVNVLVASLEWGTIEQYFLWELLIAHCIPAKHFYGLIPRLEFKKHPEAIFRFSNFLRQEKPSHDLIRLLLNRDIEKGDQFTASLLHFWSSENQSTQSKFVSILHTILSASLGNNLRDKKKNRHSQGTDESGVDLIKILGHLDFMRLNCKNISFLQEESIQTDLQQVLNSKSMLEDVKSRYSELLAFVEDEDEDLSDDEDNKNQSVVRNLRNLDSRKYMSDKKTFDDTFGHKLPVKRPYFGNDSSTSDDDSDIDTRKQYSGRSKKRLTIAD